MKYLVNYLYAVRAGLYVGTVRLLYTGYLQYFTEMVTVSKYSNMITEVVCGNS